RVVLARALAGDPRILLADEPTGNLDFKTGGAILDLLDEIHESRGITSIHVTHNLDFARRADRVLELSRGQLVPPSWLPASALSASDSAISSFDSEPGVPAPEQGRKYV